MTESWKTPKRKYEMNPRRIKEVSEEIREAGEEQKRRNLLEAGEDEDHWINMRRRNAIIKGIEDIRAAGEEQKIKNITEAEEEGDHWETPKRRGSIKPRKIFKDKRSKNQGRDKKEEIELKKYENINIQNKITPEIGKVDLEFLLLNTLIITDLKVQEVSDKFLANKPYISIFCFTEIKVDCIDFTPIGIKIISKHRKKGEKKGGGLAIGHIDDEKK